jgi:hypothetical protein
MIAAAPLGSHPRRISNKQFKKTLHAVPRKGPEAGFHHIHFDFHGLGASLCSCLFPQSQNQRKHTQNEFQTMSQSLKTGNRHIFPPFKKGYSSGNPDVR